jgi:hypothetical protein
VKSIPRWAIFVLAVYAVAALLTLGFQTYIRLDQCSGFRACTISIAKGVVWSTVWPAYWPVYAAGFIGHPGQQALARLKADIQADQIGMNGANKYVIRFPRGQMPPARGFWSLTMYDAQWFFVANPLNRYTLSQRNALKADPDGTVPLFIQASNPGPDKEANWLPAPNGPFVLTMRLYWPKEHPPSLLDGTWKPPAIVKA